MIAATLLDLCIKLYAFIIYDLSKSPMLNPIEWIHHRKKPHGDPALN